MLDLITFAKTQGSRGNNYLLNKNILSNRKLIILTIFTIIASVVLPTFSCFESTETLKKRVNFYSKIQQYSNNTIKVGSDPDKGLYCLANDYIEYGRLTMKIPKKLSICPYYIFPFKYEINNALLAIPGLNQTIGVEQRYPVYVLTYYLMYIMDAPKKQIKEYIHQYNLTDYYEVTDIDESVRDSFPQQVLGLANFDQEHFELLKRLNYPVDKDQELESVFRSVLHYLSRVDHYEIMYSWISNFDRFKWAYSIVMSRGMTLRLTEYYTLENIKVSDPNLSPSVRKNLEKNSLLGKTVGAPCVVAFIDLCNHYQPKSIYSKDRLAIVLDTTPGYFQNSATADWNPGDEIVYTYSNEPSNVVLMSHYGFNEKNNLFNEQRILVEDDFIPTLDMFNICREIGCFDQKIKSVSQIPKSRPEVLSFHSFNENILNYARIKYYKGKLDAKGIVKKLGMDRQISNINEIAALLFYYNIMRNNLKNEAKNIESAIKEGQILKNRIKKLEANWSKYDEPESLWKKLKISYNIYQMDLSYKIIIAKHADVALNRIINANQNDILKLRSKYLETPTASKQA